MKLPLRRKSQKKKFKELLFSRRRRTMSKKQGLENEVKFNHITYLGH